MLVLKYGSFRKLAVPYFGVLARDPTIEGTRLGSPIFGNPHMAIDISLFWLLPQVLRLGAQGEDFLHYFGRPLLYL